MRLSVRASMVLLFIIVPLVAASLPAWAQSESRPAPPASLVVEVEQVEQWDPSSPSVDAWANITYKLSAQDPDQTHGDFAYWVWMNGTRILELSAGGGAIGGREGWRYSPLQYGAGSGDSGVVALTITANNTAASESIFSCSVTVHFRANNTRYQCGDTIGAPGGVSALVTQEATEAGLPSVTEIRALLSADDTDPVNGSFDYWLHTGDSPDSLFNQSITWSVEAAGRLLGEVEYFAPPGQPFASYNVVYARDPLTRQVSNASCVAYVSAGVLYESGACGLLSAGAVGPGAGTPSFPMADLPAIAGATGMQVSTVGAMFAVMFIVGLGAIGFKAAGLVGGLTATAAGLGFSTVLGLVPLWITVIVFLCAVSLIVLHFRGEPA